MTAINSRTPITDPVQWLADVPGDAAHTIKVLAELLLGVTDRADKDENASRFTARCLGVGLGETIDEDAELNGVQALTVALAVGELIAEHDPDIGPCDHAEPPAWTSTEVGDTVYRHPSTLRAGFPAGTLLPATPSVIQIRAKRSYGSSPEVAVYVRRADQEAARGVLDAILVRASELNPFRGKAVRASVAVGLSLSVINLPETLTRASVVVDESVWREIDLGVTAVRDRHEMLNRHGLGCRRGVLLVGPPGTGKSAVSAAVANEALAAGFTVIYVEARAGTVLLTNVVEEAQRLGGPVLIVLEDVDLWCRDRSHGSSGGLSELLQAMDIQPDARILTLASTNDAKTLDAAAIRTGRFDGIVEVGYPDRDAAARILSGLVAGIPGEVDAPAVAGQLPENTSGSDLREIVRRAVLSGDGTVSTASLLAEIGSGRYRAQVPTSGQYL